MLFYFEFKEPYYALIAVNVNENEDVAPHDVAVQIYKEQVGDIDTTGILDEGNLRLRSPSYAFVQFMKLPENAELRVSEAIKQFEGIKNGVLIVDGALT